MNHKRGIYAKNKLESRQVNKRGRGGYLPTQNLTLNFLGISNQKIRVELFSYLFLLEYALPTICINSVPRVPSHGVLGSEWDNQG